MACQVEIGRKKQQVRPDYDEALRNHTFFAFTNQGMPYADKLLGLQQSMFRSESN